MKCKLNWSFYDLRLCKPDEKSCIKQILNLPSALKLCEPISCEPQIKADIHRAINDLNISCVDSRVYIAEITFIFITNKLRADNFCKILDYIAKQNGKTVTSILCKLKRSLNKMIDEVDISKTFEQLFGFKYNGDIYTPKVFIRQFALAYDIVYYSQNKLFSERDK